MNELDVGPRWIQQKGRHVVVYAARLRQDALPLQEHRSANLGKDDAPRGEERCPKLLANHFADVVVRPGHAFLVAGEVHVRNFEERNLARCLPLKAQREATATTESSNVAS